LLARGRIRSALRAWFEAEGFIEVETSALQVSPGNELHLSAFATGLVGRWRQPAAHLHTSPGFAYKLLAAGDSGFSFAGLSQPRRGRLPSGLHHARVVPRRQPYGS
jgi:lysyl-tRNA synthetase class 2